MKVLHLVGGDLSGGAARGAYWLHQGLNALGVKSEILSNSTKIIADKNIKYLAETKIDKIFNKVKTRIGDISIKYYRNRANVLFDPGLIGFKFANLQEYQRADIIHLHWINEGLVNIKDLKNIKKPIVWTIRDMWPMTGGCHCAIECENYKYGCGYCKQLKSNSKNDISRWLLKRKIKYIPKNIKIVGISNWICEKAKESMIFKDYDIKMIPNNIKINEFKSVNKEIAKDILEIKTDKKVISFEAYSLRAPFKAFDKLLEALKYLDKNKYFLIIFGRINELEINKLGFQYKYLGFLDDNISLKLVYSASNVYVLTSIMEAFGKTLAESMACGTPVVCFDSTGPKDIVDHKINGYRAKPFDPSDIANGIEWVVNCRDYPELVDNARKKVLREFDNKIIAGKYVDLYKSLL